MFKYCFCLVALLITSCSFVAEPRDWAFVQSVGGIAVDQPSKKDNGWVLPVRADVSGTRSITVKPSTLNSLLACTSVRVSIEGKAIYVTVKTGLTRSDLSSVCPSPNLGGIEPGSYAVLYREPGGKTFPLGKVAIGP